MEPIEIEYYFLRSFLCDDSARVTLVPGAYTRPELWRTGAVLSLPSTAVVRYRIAPGEEGQLPPYVDTNVPLISDELIEALRDAGVDNLQLFNAAIEEVAAGRIHGGHKCVNVVGLIDCAGTTRVGAEPTVDTARAHGLEFFRLAAHPEQLVVHRRIKARIEQQEVGARVEFRPASGVVRRN